MSMLKLKHSKLFLFVTTMFFTMAVWSQTTKRTSAKKTSSVNAPAQKGKPNILIIWGDDVGMWNLSCYHRGMMSALHPT